MEGFYGERMSYIAYHEQKQEINGKTGELKPCPFCGGLAMFDINSRMERGDARGWQFGISCSKCGAKTPKINYRYEITFGECGYITTIADERPLAIEAWNRRANDGEKAD